METIPLPQDAEKAVLAVLGGTPLATSAARIGIQPSDLADAVQVYCEAGRSALRNQAPGWQHLNIEFCNWATAEHTVATHIGPALQQAQANGTFGRMVVPAQTPLLAPALPRHSHDHRKRGHGGPHQRARCPYRHR